MSARVESPPIGEGTLGGSFVIAVVVALSIGGFLGSLVTYAIDNDSGTSRTFVARGTPASTAAVVWDAGKLEAMEGRVLAEQFRSAAGSAVAWDAGKLEAMKGRVLAEQFRRRPHGSPVG
jgi:hypothetical protein